MLFIIESGSLASIVTSYEKPGCSAKGTRKAYRKGVKYAVEKKLYSACDKATATIYIDAAHGGWLG